MILFRPHSVRFRSSVLKFMPIFTIRLSSVLIIDVFLEILCLLEDFLEHLILWHRRITMLCQYQNQVHLQLSLDVRTIDPVGIFRLVIHHLLHVGRKRQ